MTMTFLMSYLGIIANLQSIQIDCPSRDLLLKRADQYMHQHKEAFEGEKNEHTKVVKMMLQEAIVAVQRCTRK